MKKTQLLYEGKAKKVFKTPNPNAVIVEYKDDATAFNGLKKGTISGKGAINNIMSNHMFSLLDRSGVETHFIEELSDTETLVKRVQIILLEVIVRNIAAGSVCSRLGLTEGTVLKYPVLEFSYKRDDLGDPMINEYHAAALSIASKEEIKQITQKALRVNAVLLEFFKEKNIDLVDLKLEFGRFNGRVILADEISPDTCRLWDCKTKEKLDKDRFRRDMGGTEEAYREIFKRLNLKRRLTEDSFAADEFIASAAKSFTPTITATRPATPTGRAKSRAIKAEPPIIQPLDVPKKRGPKKGATRAVKSGADDNTNDINRQESAAQSTPKRRGRPAAKN